MFCTPEFPDVTLTLSLKSDWLADPLIEYYGMI